jgi:hypothetical protein
MIQQIKYFKIEILENNLLQQIGMPATEDLPTSSSFRHLRVVLKSVSAFRDQHASRKERGTSLQQAMRIL